MLRFALILISLSFSQVQIWAQTETSKPQNDGISRNSGHPDLRGDSLKVHHDFHDKISELEIPLTHQPNAIIRHLGYSFLYNEQHEQANWVAYELTKEETINLFERNNHFIPDPSVVSGSANNEDYEGSGYDRGHLAPAADMEWSEIAMAESFYYSNMSPQEPGFNRGIWKKLEEQVRVWAIENQSLYIVTGPVLRNGLHVIGPDKVSVPELYYKVILDYTQPDYKAIGFVMRNSATNVSLINFAVSIDSVESLTGIDFYPKLPDEQENILEKTICIPCWNWGSSHQESGLKQKNSPHSVQCSAKTKKGTRCKNFTDNPSGRCYKHER